MKKLLLLLIACAVLSSPAMAKDRVLSVKDLNKMGIVANSSIKQSELNNAKKIIQQLQLENSDRIKRGYGPFLAAIYDQDGNLISKKSNTVIKEHCCLNHSEMNAIKEACQKLETYDLGKKHLSIYITAEPCIMCMGGIMWSGIDNIYYGVSSKDVEQITGFDEGYKPNWIQAFKTRKIKVYGNIEANAGKTVLKEYLLLDQKVYKPTR